MRPKILVLLICLYVMWVVIEKVSSRPTAIPQGRSSIGSSRPEPNTNEREDYFSDKLRQSCCSQNVESAPDPTVSDFTSEHHCVILNDKVNCSARDFTYIPQTDFPEDIEVYDLSRNHIAALPSHAFSRYTSLKELNLEQNVICRIDPLAFVGLSNLEFLNLYENKLIMNNETLKTAFADNVFTPLTKLVKLRLEGNNPQPNSKKLRYPDKALSQLGNLVELHLDGLKYAVFGSGFANLKKLSNLSLEGYQYGRCDLTTLKNDTFQYLTQLEILNLNECNLQGNFIEAGTFLPLRFLKQLYLNYNQDINVQFFDRLFFGLQHTTSLKTLSMESVVRQYTVGICLSSQYIKYFPQSVAYLNVKHNRLECIDREVIDKVKTSLEVLDISRNNFIFGTYLMDLPKLEKLTTIILDDKIIAANELPRSYPYNPHTPPLDIGNCSLYARNDQDIIAEEQFMLHLPPKLKKVKMRYTQFLYIFSRFSIDTNNSLENLRMEGNYFPYLKGPLIGLNSLMNFHLSLNNIRVIKGDFFETFPSLVTLNLSSNYLGDFFVENPKTKIFQSLVRLETLDLATNTIRVLGPRIFDGMTELKYLRISHNPIFYFHTDLTHKSKLTTFIAIDTSLSLLRKETRDVFSAQVKMGLSVRVELEQSPIVCDCPNLPFLEWMVRSGAFQFKSKDYRCYYPDTSSIEIHDGYAETIQLLSRQCSSHESLLFILVAGTICFATFIICSLGYRYRWKLRYLYHAAYIYMARGSRPANHFEYDVFVCYAEEDRHFVMDILYPALEARGLSVFVHHRHFTAGELIGSNIVRAVNTCRRTVVVLTRTLAESSWCNYEIQMANMESAQRGSPVLIFLLLGGMRGCEMKKELLYNVQNNTYIKFPPAARSNERALNAVYDKLARDITH